MRLTTFPLCLGCLVLFSALANAQVAGCPFSTANRTVEVCTPAEGADISEGFFLNWHVTDSLPYTLCVFADGTNLGCDFQFVVPGSAHVDLPSAGWHRYTFVATDSSGSFRSTTRFRITSQGQCPTPGTDRQIDICSPFSGANVLSPVHISAVANSTSVPAKNTIAYINGVEVARSFHTINLLPGTSLLGNTISTFFPLAVGQYTLQIKVVDQNNRTFSKSITFTVVPTGVN
jgi:hypothetical protein